MLEPGQTFAARYRVMRRISEGGMAAIFEAEHTATERRVALKLLFPHIMTVVSARQKFELEARVSARVNSPHIVEVLDAGFDEGTQSPYLVMELLSGETLAEHVQSQGRLEIDDALPLLRQVASGLDAAHGYKDSSGVQKAIVHRDLKPENLFVTREHDGSSLVKILDFGIAKVLGDTSNVSQEVRGTPLYMAYEQVIAGPLSPETDVWALGLITYYMLTGRHYWRCAAQRGAGVQSLFAEILTLPIEAPSLRSMQQQLDVQLPAAFDAWLLRCLERDPSRRFAAAGTAIDELARAFGRAARAKPRAVPKPAPAARIDTTAFQASPVQGLTPSTAASLPAIASERASAALVPRSPKSSRWLAAAIAIAGGAVLAAALAWSLRGADADPPVAETSGSRRPSAAAAPSVPATVTPPTPPASNESAKAASTPSLSDEPPAEIRVAPVEKGPEPTLIEPDTTRAPAVQGNAVSERESPQPGHVPAPPIDARKEAPSPNASDPALAPGSSQSKVPATVAPAKPAKRSAYGTR